MHSTPQIRFEPSTVTVNLEKKNQGFLREIRECFIRVLRHTTPFAVIFLTVEERRVDAVKRPLFYLHIKMIEGRCAY